MNLLDNEEQWRHLDFLPPSIEVSNFGNIRKYVTMTEFVSVKQSMSSGYYFVSIEGNSFPVHRLVALAFIENPDDFPIVNHINGNKLDNSATNLEWISASDNIKRSHIWGTDRRNKIYCPELDLVFGSLRSAAFYTSFPQDLISRSIAEGKTIAGMTFVYVSKSDALVANHDIFYVDFDNAFTAACEASDKEAFIESLKTNPANFYHV